MKRLFVGAIVGFSALAIAGGITKAYQANNPEYQKQKNEELITEIITSVKELDMCDASKHTEVTKYLANSTACLKLLNQQLELVKQIQTAESNRDRKNYRKASKVLIKQANASLNAN